MRALILLGLMFYSSIATSFVVEDIVVAWINSDKFDLHIIDKTIIYTVHPHEKIEHTFKYDSTHNTFIYDDTKNKSKHEEYNFLEECTVDYGGGWMPVSFSCDKKGHTPLAGATYKLIKFGKSKSSCASDSDQGSRYICTQGCKNSMAPKYLEAFDGMC